MSAIDLPVRFLTFLLHPRGRPHMARRVWLAAMERRVKSGDLRNVWCHIEDCADRREIVRLMQWRQPLRVRGL